MKHYCVGMLHGTSCTTVIGWCGSPICWYDLFTRVQGELVVLAHSNHICIVVKCLLLSLYHYRHAYLSLTVGTCAVWLQLSLCVYLLPQNVAAYLIYSSKTKFHRVLYDLFLKMLRSRCRLLVTTAFSLPGKLLMDKRDSYGFFSTRSIATYTMRRLINRWL